MDAVAWSLTGGAFERTRADSTLSFRCEGGNNCWVFFGRPREKPEVADERERGNEFLCVFRERDREKKVFINDTERQI